MYYKVSLISISEMLLFLNVRQVCSPFCQRHVKQTMTRNYQRTFGIKGHAIELFAIAGTAGDGPLFQ